MPEGACRFLVRCMAPAARRKSLAGIAARHPCCIAPTTRSKRSRRVKDYGVSGMSASPPTPVELMQCGER